MKKSHLTSAVPRLLLLLAALLPQYHCTQPVDIRPTDGTFLQYKERLAADNTFAAAQKQYENTINTELDAVRAGGVALLPSETVTIPVVVHFVRTAGSPQPDKALVEKQISALNRDFRRQNKDEIAAIPPAFSQLAADTRVQFRLVKADTSGAAVDGFTVLDSDRETPFTYQPMAATGTERSPVKFSQSDGTDAWPASMCLNIWVCDLDSTLGEGYTSLPADLAARPAEDGVVIDQAYFGFSAHGREKGRSLTNLVAKWLGLKDLWGIGGVAASDDSEDTPEQRATNTGCPSYPLHNSQANPYGDMFHNFMDATDDACRVMFTADQATRIYTNANRHRGGFAAGVPLINPAADGDDGGPYFYMEDTSGDGGVENGTPPAGTILYYSSDIRGNTSSAETGYFTPVRPEEGQTNYYLHVWVHKAGGAIPIAGTLHLYYARASAGLNPYPSAVWTEIGTGQALQNGSLEEYVFPWNPVPDASLIDDHYCLLARIEGERACGCTGGAAGTCPTQGMYCYVGGNRQVAWRNVNITDTDGIIDGNDAGFAPMQFSGVGIQNAFAQPTKTRLRFSIPAGEASAFQYGKIAVSGKRLLELWEQGDRQGSGIVQQDSLLIIQKEGAEIDNLLLDSMELTNIELRFIPDGNTPKQRDVYLLNLEQWNADANGGYSLTGGQIFVVKNDHDPKLPAPPPTPGSRWMWWVVGLLVLLAGYGGLKYLRKG